MKQAIEEVMAKAASGEISYPQFVTLLARAGVVSYKTEVSDCRISFKTRDYKTHVDQGHPVSGQKPGVFNKELIKAAIADAQQKKIDHRTFLKRIHDAGVIVYDVDILSRRIDYQGENDFYIEHIPKE